MADLPNSLENLPLTAYATYRGATQDGARDFDWMHITSRYKVHIEVAPSPLKGFRITPTHLILPNGAQEKLRFDLPLVHSSAKEVADYWQRIIDETGQPVYLD